MITVAISGSSGFLGTQLCNFLNHKYNIIKLKRSDYSLAPDKLALVLKGSDYVINLAGAPIFGLWTKSYRRKILQSRIETTRNLVRAITVMERKPKLFISASGVNIYDDKNTHTEDSLEFAHDFLADVCLQWEREALSCSVPSAIIRTGLIVGSTGGFFDAISKTIPFGFALKFGPGNQHFPFLHVHDYVSAIDFIMDKELSDVFNMVSPEVTTYQGFYEALKSVKRPLLVVMVPSFLLKLLPGGQSAVFLKGQHVVPKHLLNAGFEYRYASIDDTLRNLKIDS